MVRQARTASVTSASESFLFRGWFILLFGHKLYEHFRRNPASALVSLTRAARTAAAVTFSAAASNRGPATMSGCRAPANAAKANAPTLCNG